MKTTRKELAEDSVCEWAAMHQQTINTGDKDFQIVRCTGVPYADQHSEVFVGTAKGQNRDDSSVGCV